MNRRVFPIVQDRISHIRLPSCGAPFFWHKTTGYFSIDKIRCFLGGSARRARLSRRIPIHEWTEFSRAILGGQANYGRLPIFRDEMPKKTNLVLVVFLLLQVM